MVNVTINMAYNTDGSVMLWLGAQTNKGESSLSQQKEILSLKKSSSLLPFLAAQFPIYILLAGEFPYVALILLSTPQQIPKP